MELRSVIHVAGKEVRDSLRNRWFLMYATSFGVLALALSSVSLTGTGFAGLAGYGRTAASLVNLVLLVVPLMALTVGAGSLAGERERGTLDYLLAQPITRGEVLLGKYVGLSLALLATLATGFGASGLVIAWGASAADVAGYAAMVGAALFLALAMLSLGMLISTFARKASVAVGAAIFLWLGLSFVSDLGLMGGTMLLDLSITDMFVLAVVNPLQVFKMTVLGSIHASLDVLGPVGTYATLTYGGSLTFLFVASLTAWVLVPLSVALAVFTRRGVA